ncbi:MAG: sulfotransferase [Flavobacteriales bacterium]|nr:sulfotransferase [Flavobacteriales bacterium]
MTRGRSGSTLLQSTLDSHPHICAPNESDFVLHLRTRYAACTDWNEALIAKFIRDLYSNRKYRLFWKVDQSVLAQLFTQYKVTSFADACKVVYLSYQSPFPKKGIHLIVDKNPVHCNYIPVLRSFFPDAQFIHLVRDPRAVVNSVNKSFHKNNIPRLAKSWVKANNRIESQKDGSSFITVRYENLVQQPESTLKTILDFVGEAYDPDMLKSHEVLGKIKSKHANYSLSHHKNIGKEISSSFINKWERELTPEEIDIIAHFTHEFASRYGYTIPKPNLDLKKQKLIEYQAERKLLRFKRNIYYKLPFSIRKAILNLISRFSDKKYKQ